MIQKWPNIKILPISTTWDWLRNKTHYFNGMSVTAIDRAINAFTYLFVPDNYYQALFYCLIGIEALLNTNQKNGIEEQIKSKCALLFDENSSYKKMIKKMYDIRSRFIHGQLDFPPSQIIYDGADELYKFDISYVETLQTAQAILLATIQNFITNNASELITNTTLTFA